MTPQELIQITGQHLLFLGVNTYAWGVQQFQDAAKFAKAHGVDALLVKVADGNELWYGNWNGWLAMRSAVLNEGVGFIPYVYSYGNKFGALEAEVDLMLGYMRDAGIVCMDAEAEWNGHTDWAQYLCGRVQGQAGTFMVSTWADPSLQNWQGVIAALAPCTTVFMPQQYNNYLMTFWNEFAANGATWLQPTVNLTQEFGANDPVAIAQAAAGQGHTAISVWYYDQALANPGLLDAVYAAFPKQGGPTVQQYSPNSSDFNDYFTVDANGNWICKTTSAVIIGGNKALFSQLSIDGNTLPVIGLPLENEQYHTESDNYRWSTQRFERATMVYDPDHRFDSQPGLGASYLSHSDRYQPSQPATLPDVLKADIEALPALANQTMSAWQAAFAKLWNDAGLPTQ